MEGTPAYLPPEFLTKRVRLPGFAADAWALGCVTYFCLYGRPKFFGDSDQVFPFDSFNATFFSANIARGFVFAHNFTFLLTDRFWPKSTSADKRRRPETTGDPLTL